MNYMNMLNIYAVKYSLYLCKLQNIFVADYINLYISYMKLNITLNLHKTTMHAVYECSLELELNMTTYITFHILILKDECI